MINVTFFASLFFSFALSRKYGDKVEFELPANKNGMMTMTMMTMEKCYLERSSSGMLNLFLVQYL